MRAAVRHMLEHPHQFDDWTVQGFGMMRCFRGTVTLNERTRVGTGEHARVFWPAGEDWVNAKPRQATPREIDRTTELALSVWRDDT